jgi:3-methyladenine DNA glycosylase/8-oxoguanine DNA glycosylase
MLLIYSLERRIFCRRTIWRAEGYRRLKGLEVQPTRKQMIEIGLAWSPYRTVAAWYLWRVSNLIDRVIVLREQALRRDDGASRSRRHMIQPQITDLTSTC